MVTTNFFIEPIFGDFLHHFIFINFLSFGDFVLFYFFKVVLEYGYYKVFEVPDLVVFLIKDAGGGSAGSKLRFQLYKRGGVRTTSLESVCESRRTCLGRYCESSGV